MAKPIPLLDPLGLPVSPEALWEQFTGVIKIAGEVSTETTKYVFGLDMDGNFTDFQSGRSKNPDVAKTPQLLAEEQRNAELDRKRMFFATLTEDLKRAQGVAHTPEIDSMTVAAATIETEDRNEMLGHQKGLRRKHTENAYSIAYTRAKLIEQNKNQGQIEDVPIPSPAKQPHALETQFEGGYGKVGSGTGSLSSASGAVG